MSNRSAPRPGPRVWWTRRARIAVAACATAVLLGAGALSGATRATDAAWVDPEYAAVATTAGTVNPVTNMTCTPGPILNRTYVTVAWDPPSTASVGTSGAIAPTHYHYRVSTPMSLIDLVNLLLGGGVPEFSVDEVIEASATRSVTVNNGLLGSGILGTGYVEVWAEYRTAGGAVWESEPRAYTYSNLLSIYSCSNAGYPTV